MASKPMKSYNTGKNTNRGWTLRNAMVIMANIPLDATKEKLLKLFPNEEEIEEFRFLEDDKFISNTKTAIIQFFSTSAAVTSIDYVNGHYYNGKMLVVFSVKRLRDYVRIPESTFLLASQDSGFNNKDIFRIFSPHAHIDHFFTNTRNKSNPHTGVAVFKNEKEYSKAESLIKSWNNFEKEHIMAIKVPTLDDFYPHGMARPRSFSDEYHKTELSEEMTGDKSEFYSDSEMEEIRSEESTEKIESDDVKHGKEEKLEQGFSVFWKTANFVSKKKRVEVKPKAVQEEKLEYPSPEQIWGDYPYESQLYQGFPLFGFSPVNDREDSHIVDCTVFEEDSEKTLDSLIGEVLGDVL